MQGQRRRRRATESRAQPAKHTRRLKGLRGNLRRLKARPIWSILRIHVKSYTTTATYIQCSSYRRKQEDTDGRDRRREGKKKVAMRLEEKKTNGTGRGRRNSLKNDSVLRISSRFFFPLLSSPSSVLSRSRSRLVLPTLDRGEHEPRFSRAVAPNLDGEFFPWI